MYLKKRFWKSAVAGPLAGGFGILLDGKALKTPGHRELSVPARAFADAIAEEWEAVSDQIDPQDLPFTRMANTALDRVSDAREAVIDDLAAYGETDLICYRADGPGELQELQAAAWDPWLQWARDELKAPLFAVAGVNFQAQPDGSVAALRVELSRHDAFALVALHDLVTLSGSLVLSLAVSQEAMPAEEGWRLSRVDETWQADRWGYDDEAEAVAQRKRGEFLRAARVLGFLRA